MNKLVEIFERIFGFKLIVTRVPRMENDPMVRRPDIRSAKRILGFSPKIGLEEGLHKIFRHFCETYPPEIMDM